MTKTVLIIAYFFPPVGGAGVQRVTKFVKYLPEFDWRPVVLTAENPSVPLFDDSLSADIADEVEVLRAKTFEPGYQLKNAVSASASETGTGVGLVARIKNLLRKIANLLLQPDPQILWYPRASRAASQYLRDNKVDVIFATGPPFSSFVLGRKLSRKHGVPLILDYRDEWDISNEVLENKTLDGFSAIVQRRMQKRAISQASMIVATTRMSMLALQEKCNSLGANAKTDFIYNGYDATDFSSDVTSGRSQQQQSKYQLSYVGTLWNLTSIAPVIDALLLLEATSPKLAESVELVVAGRRTADQDALLNRLTGSSVSVVREDYLDHDDAVSLMQSSQGLCLLLSDVSVAGRVVPAKTFEYMVCGNSIFVVAPRGEVWELLEDYPGAHFAEPGDIDSLCMSLRADVEKFLAGDDGKSRDYDASRYERRALTDKLGGLLTEVVADHVNVKRR